jgi:hypothetical protein
LARRGEPRKIATSDLDAIILESWKQQAQTTYQGERGAGPLWAEMNPIVSDPFREGNVPAQQEPLEAAWPAFRVCRRA